MSPTTEPSKRERAKVARETIHKNLPSLLASDSRARAGVDGSTLLKDLSPIPKCGKLSDPLLQVWHTDTISAALKMCASSSSKERIAILNMASPLRPGGGVLTGATSQEEYLCSRTTLYPSLKEEFYRLPETGLIYTKDVLVFRDSSGNNLAKSDRIYVDVVTAAMLRFPDLIERDGEATWAEDKDRETVLSKMRMVMRSLVLNGVKRVVLGAWGCGAYANPTPQVARRWKLVLLGNRNGRKEEWKGITDVIFAITNLDQAEVFKKELRLSSD